MATKRKHLLPSSPSHLSSRKLLPLISLPHVNAAREGQSCYTTRINKLSPVDSEKKNIFVLKEKLLLPLEEVLTQQYVK